VRILASDHGGAAGCTDRITAEGVLEQDPFIRQTVDGWRGIQRGQATAVRADGVGRVVVGHDVEDVGFLRTLDRRGNGEEKCGQMFRSHRASFIGMYPSWQSDCVINVAPCRSCARESVEDRV
jgi:hypothetical protein